ncbi:MAG TPA: hypothetical protein VEI97_04350, partial [bacterium]|nr:hypothetical protein [bacterium]
ALASRPQGSAEGTLAIWDLVTGEQRLVVKEKEKLVRALSFSDDGRLLAAATPDPTPKLFQIAE